MSQDELYEWIVDEDCSAQPEPDGHSWIDAMVARRENALEVMLREKLQAHPERDLLDAALNEQWIRHKFHMRPLVIE